MHHAVINRMIEDNDIAETADLGTFCFVFCQDVIVAAILALSCTVHFRCIQHVGSCAYLAELSDDSQVLLAMAKYCAIAVGMWWHWFVTITLWSSIIMALATEITSFWQWQVPQC